MSESEDSGPGLREVAYRLFATEYDDASLEYSESDEERAPNYVVTPTGARVNRLFVVGVLTSVESVNEETVRARIVDPTGAFVVYAGQYQPEALAFFERAEPPAFVAVTGKANTFQPEGSDRVLTSLRPEQVNEVDAETRDRWVLTAAEQTLSRIGITARALDREERGAALERVLRESGVDDALASGIPRALEHYGTTPDYLGALRDVAIDAIGVVAERRDEVQSLSVAPDEQSGEYTAAVLAEREPTAPTLEAVADDVEPEPEEATVPTERSETAAAGASQSRADTDSASVSTSGSETEAETESEPVEATAGAGGGASSSTTGGETTTTDAESTTPNTESPTTDAESGLSGAKSSAESKAASATEPAGSETTSPNEEEDSDRLGNFEPSGSIDEDSAETDDQEALDADSDTDPDELYEIDDEEREEIESEYGVEFSSGTEVDEPGEADIDVPTTEEEAASDPGVDAEVEPGATESEETAETADQEPAKDDGQTEDEDPRDGEDAVAANETAAEGDTTTDDEATARTTESDDEPTEEPAADADVDEVLLDRMEALDEGEGADREDVIASVTEATGAGEETVVEAIDEALMSGKCYEPDDTTLKPI
jgi:RPA family protein